MLHNEEKPATPRMALIMLLWIKIETPQRIIPSARNKGQIDTLK
jgi:hypothetical protein